MAYGTQSFTSNSRTGQSLTYDSSIAKNETLTFTIPFKNILILGFLVLLSAIGLTYVQENNRCLFVEYQKLQKQYEVLHANYARMTLERNSIASRPQVQEIAEQKLQMHMPMPDEVVMIER